jgi:hypothetical protein
LEDGTLLGASKRATVLGREAVKGIARELVGQPVLDLHEAQATIEVARRVPVQHREAHTGAAALTCDRGRRPTATPRRFGRSGNGLAPLGRGGDLQLRACGVVSRGPVLMVQVDDEAMAVAQPGVAMRVAVRLGPLPALVLMAVMLVVEVQMLVAHFRVLVLEQLGIGRRPQPQRKQARAEHEQAKEAERPEQCRRRQARRARRPRC